MIDQSAIFDEKIVSLGHGGVLIGVVCFHLTRVSSRRE
jgi:hypothetical protein